MLTIFLIDMTLSVIRIYFYVGKSTYKPQIASSIDKHVLFLVLIAVLTTVQGRKYLLIEIGQRQNKSDNF